MPLFIGFPEWNYGTSILITETEYKLRQLEIQKALLIGIPESRLRQS